MLTIKDRTVGFGIWLHNGETEWSTQNSEYFVTDGMLITNWLSVAKGEPIPWPQGTFFHVYFDLDSHALEIQRRPPDGSLAVSRKFTCKWHPLGYVKPLEEEPTWPCPDNPKETCLAPK